MTSQHAAYAAVYPISDQLPLGQAAGHSIAERRIAEQLAAVALRSSDLLASDGVKTGHDPDERAGSGPVNGEAVTNRPFGLRFATRPTSAPISLEGIRYDEQAQVSLARDEHGWVPLTDHSMGLTLRTTGEIPREDEIHDKS